MSELIKNCNNCSYWNMNHWGKIEGFNGCSIWNNFKHFGKIPHTIDQSRNFEEVFELLGPMEAYEGWAGQGGTQYNNSIITKSDGSCELWKTKQSEG